MTNFVKFSDVRKKRNHLDQMANDIMADVKGGVLICNGNYYTCKYVRTCPYGHSCINVSLYSAPNVDR